MMQIIAKNYGPYAFGLISFLAMWFAAVKPELDRRETSVIEQRELLKQMVLVSSTMDRTANTLERIALIRSSDGQ